MPCSEPSLGGVEAQAVAAEEGSFGDQEDNLATIGNPVLRMFKQVGIDDERKVITFVRR